MRRLNHYFSNHGLWLLLWTGFGVLAAILISVASNAFYDLIKENGAYSVVVVALALTVTGAIVTWLVAVPAALRTFSGTHARVLRLDPRGEPQPHQAIILMQSRLSEVALSATAIADRLGAQFKSDRKSARRAIIENKELQAARWPWQQTLRLVNAFPDLKLIVVILSEQVAGDKHFPDFKRIIESYGPEGVSVLAVAKPVPPLDYNAVEAAVNSAIETCRDHGHNPRRTCIDITGGLKTFGAVAAVKTLNSGFTFSYVVTAADTGGASAAHIGQVYIYDASVWAERDGG